MTLSEAAVKILNQLAGLVKEIHETDFASRSDVLSGSTIGEHIRHTIEFFHCFESGVRCGKLNYDKRAHSKLIETDRALALKAINKAISFVSSVKKSNPLNLEVRYDPVNEEYLTVETNTSRELVYNIEHAVHHMAIIKIGIREIAPYVALDEDFGVAASTIRFASPETHPS